MDGGWGIPRGSWCLSYPAPVAGRRPPSGQCLRDRGRRWTRHDRRRMGARVAATADGPFAEIARLRSFGAADLADYLAERRWSAAERMLFEQPDQWISGRT